LSQQKHSAPKQKTLSSWLPGRLLFERSAARLFGLAKTEARAAAVDGYNFYGTKTSMTALPTRALHHPHQSLGVLEQMCAVGQDRSYYKIRKKMKS
jgi:hypothetical protein